MTVPLLRRLALCGALLGVAVAAVPGCSRAYRSSYKPLSEALQPPAVDASDVQVLPEGIAAPAHAIELGTYRGRAPTRDEVIEAARRRCGEVGGRYLLVRSQGPRDSAGVWELEGVCAWTAS